MVTFYNTLASDITEFHLALQESIAPIRTFLQSAKAHRQVIQSIRKSNDVLASNFSFTSQIVEIVSKRELFEQYISNVGNEISNNGLLCGLRDSSTGFKKFQYSPEAGFRRYDTYEAADIRDVMVPATAEVSAFVPPKVTDEGESKAAHSMYCDHSFPVGEGMFC